MLNQIEEEYKCDTCVYRTYEGLPWKCNYSEIMNHSRGCEPGDLCTKYIQGDRIKVKKDQIVIKPKEDSLETFCDTFAHFN